MVSRMIVIVPRAVGRSRKLSCRPVRGWLSSFDRRRQVWGLLLIVMSWAASAL